MLKSSFQGIAEIHITLGSQKCNLLGRKVAFLRHNVSEDGTATDSLKVQAVKEWLQPKNATDNL